MENPFKVLGEAFTAGLEKLHKRADSVEADVCEFKDDVSGFKKEMAHFTNEVEADVTDMKDRLAKMEAMFAPETVSAVTDKVASAGTGTADQVNSQIASDPAPSDPNSGPTTPTITNPSPSVTIAVVPAAATEAAVVDTPIGTVTVQPGTTVHVDAATLPEDAAVTTVPHDGSTPSASTAAGADVTPDPTVVALAKVASADAGVTVGAAS